MLHNVILYEQERVMKKLFLRYIDHPLVSQNNSTGHNNGRGHGRNPHGPLVCLSPKTTGCISLLQCLFPLSLLCSMTR